VRISSLFLSVTILVGTTVVMGSYWTHTRRLREIEILRVKVGRAEFLRPLLRTQWSELRTAFFADPGSGIKAGDAAMFLHSSGNNDAALACYAWAQRLDPWNLRWTYYPALIKIESADPVGAKALLDICRQHHPSDNTVLAKQAFVLSRLGDPFAVSAYQELIRRDFFRASAHTEYGMLLMRFGRQSEAGEEFKTALSLNPSDGRPNIWLTHILAKAGYKTESNAAKASVSGATVLTNEEVDPYLDELYWRFPQVRYLKVRAAGEAAHRRFAEGLRLLERARSAAPDDTAIIVDLVYYKTLLDGPEEGRVSLEQAVKDPHAAPTALFNYGLALQQRGLWEPACKTYRSVLAREPNFLEALNGLGNCEENSGHPKRAAALYRQAAHGNSLAVANLARLAARGGSTLGPLADARGPGGSAKEAVSPRLAQADAKAVTRSKPDDRDR
jgi:tetratricopeptide (TPR) repeat protein